MKLPGALPELRGRWLAAYRLLWWITLLLALVGITYGTATDFRWGRKIDAATYGAGVRIDQTTRPYTISPFSREAQAAGIEPGSVLLTVDGRAVKIGDDRATTNAIAEALQAPDGQRLILTMRAPDGSVADHAVIRGPHHLASADQAAPITYANRIRFYMVNTLVAGLVTIVGAVLLYRRRASDPVVALLSLGLLGLSASGAANLFSRPEMVEGFQLTLNNASLVLLMLAMTVFPSGKFVPRWTLAVVPLIFGTALASQLLDLPVVIGLMLAIVVLASILTALAVRYRALPAGPQRQQIKWAVLGFALFTALALAGMLLEYFNQQAQTNATHLTLLILSRLTTPLSITVLVAGLLISLLRHRLYDADAAISRSALYGGMTLFLVAVFAAFGKLFESLGEQYFGDTAGMAAGAIAAGIAALLLVPLHNRLSRWAENRFQRDIATMRAALPELLAELRDSENPRNLADDALRLAIRGVRASHGAILLAGRERMELTEASGIGAGVVQAIIPALPEAPEPGLKLADYETFPLQLPLLTASGVLTGWLLLGPHPDGSLYGKDDREALEEIASPLARALLLAMDRARRAEARSAETAALRQTMDTVAQSLAEIAERIAPSRRGPRKAQTIN